MNESDKLDGSSNEQKKQAARNKHAGRDNEAEAPAADKKLNGPNRPSV